MEMGMHRDAEEVAHFCYNLLPLDVIVLGRASQCMHNKTKERNKAVIEKADRIFKLVRKVVVSYNEDRPKVSTKVMFTFFFLIVCWFRAFCKPKLRSARG